MKECAERIIKVGFSRKPKEIFSEIEVVTARMAREGWTLVETVMEDGLSKAHLFFERDLAGQSGKEP